MKKAILFVGIVLLSGCSFNHKYESKTQRQQTEPPFQGQPADKPVDYDLAGVWNVSRVFEEGTKSKAGRWEAKWVLEKRAERLWVDTNGQGSFTLGEPTKNGQTLRWDRREGSSWYFSINEQSFGLLMMTDSNGERYMAVRSD